VLAAFDDPNLVSCGGLAPVLELAASCGLAGLVSQKLTLREAGGVNAHLKVPAMVAGADSIEDMDLLRHGGMDRLFGGVRAPSTLGTFLRAFTFGHVRQLDAVAATMLERLAGRTPLLPAAETIAFLDIDDTIRATYGYAKQGAGYGYSKVQGHQRPARHDQHPGGGTGDRGDPATQRIHQLRPRRGPTGRRRPGHRCSLWGRWAGHPAR
jgi:hypothetical protein